jgi:hypothetical protein
MSRRWWWSRELKQENANLIWTQLKVLEVYTNQPSAKRDRRELPQCNYEVGDKDRRDPAGKIMNQRMFAVWRNHLCQNYQKEKKATLGF